MGLSMHIMPIQYSFGRKLREADFHVKLLGEVAALVKGLRILSRHNVAKVYQKYYLEDLYLALYLALIFQQHRGFFIEVFRLATQLSENYCLSKSVAVLASGMG